MAPAQAERDPRAEVGALVRRRAPEFEVEERDMDEAWGRSGKRSLWYHLGYTLERARGRTGTRRFPSLAERRRAARGPEAGREARDAPGPDAPPPGREPWDWVLWAAARALAGRTLGPVGRRPRPGPLRLLRAGVAGAGSALGGELVRPLITGKPRKEPLRVVGLDAALVGAQRGLLYGSLVEPLIPATPLLRGAAYGLIEHLAAPWGGLAAIVGSRAPHRALALVSVLLEDSGPRDDTLTEHLAFGITLAALLGDPAR